MKKLVTLLLTAALAITAATTAFADDITAGADGNPNPASKQIDVTYTVNPSYTVTIPANVKLSSNPDGTVTGTATVEATGVTIPKGQTLKVAISSGTGFKVKIGDNADAPTLNYNVYKVTHSGNITSRDIVDTTGTVLEVAADAMFKKGTTSLEFLVTDKVVYSGTYKDTVTFTVSLE